MLQDATARQKVKGGKLLVVKIKHDVRIASIQVLGDFFIVPEDALPKIESALVGIGIGEQEGKISSIISEAVKRNNVELIGIDPDAIAHTIRMALE
jgi:lipoate-protein ligase A